MSQLSIIEELQTFWKITSSSKLFIIPIVVLLVLAFLFITTNKSNAKVSKRIYLGIYVIAISALIICFYTSLGSMFDYLMNNVFVAIFFPNLAIYLIAIIVANIILWRTIFNWKSDKALKVINTIIYCFIHYLLILVLSVITSKKLDVFSQTSIYSNKQVLALIELSSTIFIIWICFLIVYHIIRSFQRGKQEEIVFAKETSKVKKTAKNTKVYNIVEAPYFVSGDIKKEENKNVEVFNDNKQKIRDIYEGMLTLDDYKLLLSILKEEKEARKNNPVIEKTRIRTNEMIVEDKVEVKTQSSSALTELLDLYKTVR